MTDLVARLRLEASAGNTSQVVGAVRREVEGLAPAGARAAGGMREVQTATASFERSAGSARAAGAALGATLGLLGGRELVNQLKDAAFATAGLTTGLSAVAGGAQGAADAQGFVREQSERLGLVIRESTAGYLQLAAATNGTALAGQKTKDIWLGLNEAGTVLNLSQEKQKSAMEAISQIANKGLVSQEELRQQLAEALPGAYQVAARAMGLTTQEFGKLVDSGKLLSEDFLPKFAAQLSREFGPKIDAALTTPIGQARLAFADFKNTTDGLTATAGMAFLEGLTSGLQALNAELGSADTREAAQALGKSLGEGLSAAAQGAAFLVEHLDEVQAVAGAVVAIGLAKWLVTSASEARGAAAAYLAKAQAAQSAGAVSVVAAQGETAAVTTLRGAILATAQAEVRAAATARDLALANEQAAVATLAQARAEAASLVSTMALSERRALVATAERNLAAAQIATAGASARAEAAAVGLARATTAGGAAAQGAKALFGGLMTMLGGPWGIALGLAGAAIYGVTSALDDNKRAQEELKASGERFAQVMRDTASYARPAADGVRTLGKESQGAVAGTDALANSVRGLADQTFRLANAKAQAKYDALSAEREANAAKIDQLESPSLGTKARNVVGGWVDSFTSWYRGYNLDLSGLRAREEQVGGLLKMNAALDARMLGILLDPSSNREDASSPPSATGGDAKADRVALRAQDKSADLEALRLAQEAYTRALIAGGAALDDWHIKEAGRQAVERLALADRPKLTAAEQALVEQIRSRAEETERLKIANERIEKAIGLQKTAEADTAALQRRSAAALEGEAALETLQVREAGVQALQQLGVDTLDQLTGATLDHAKAAIATAEAKEKQSIATAKAERVAAQIRDLALRTTSELDYARAVAGGTAALVAYQREEAVRQELERAGKTLTDDQVAALRAKAEAFFAARAAADSADLTARQAEELRLAQLTNSQRATEERYLQRKSLLLAEHADWTEAEVEARARALALADEAAAQDAKAKGELKEGLKQAFIESGRLGFEDVGDFVERRLREAVYNALLAQPIDILINAVIGSVGGMNALGAGSGLGQVVGAAGLGSLFNSAGGLAGLTTGAASLATSVLGKLGMSGWNAAKFGGMAGGAIGGAGTGMLVSSVAGMLGLKQNKGNQIGSSIGGAIGSFIPIPGGAILGSIAGNLIGGLVAGKPSNQAAVASLDAKGNVVSMDGAKRTDATTAAATQVAQAVAQIQAALVAGGATLSATVSKIDIGTRDSTHLNFSNGTSIDTAVGDVSAAIEAATKTIIANAKWASEAQTAYAQKLLAAGATIDQVVAAMATAGGFAGSIDDAIQQLVDPAAYAKKQALDAIDANYQALKAQAQELMTAGLATEDVLGKIERLKELQVDEALKRLGSAADGAAGALAGLEPDAFQRSVGDAIAQLRDPTGFERSKALGDIEANIAEMKTQAAGLVAAGKLSTEIFAQLDTLRDLQVADSIKKLGDAAGDAAQALKDAASAQKAAADFASGIDDAILQLTDPVAAQIQQINRDYAAKIETASAMVAAGQLGGDVLDKLASLRDLQIQEVMQGLADSATDATDAFADARPRLQAWLDSLGVGANSPLNAGEQRQAAMASYERVLERARAGDADALSQITGLGDQLLSADRTATSSATARLALFNKVQGDIQGLAATSGAGLVGADPRLTEAKRTTDLLKKIETSLDPQLVALRPAAPIEVKLSPWLQTLHKETTGEQTKTLQEALEKLTTKTEDVRSAVTDGLSKVGVALENGLAGLGGAFAASAAETAAEIGALADQVGALAQSQQLTTTYMRRAVEK
ncbi:tape measure protein [Caulobacter sp. SL161]|uniref:tape measure protein n=1 Tax=Caulobacter sp. SL161 TaxID=2995156 RepID=UPI002273AE34|nr:tape measure protein [Caulobacter sp. SL161]MCY1648186.1 tape measure protein [Caulobacter sp. SL161]